MDPSSLELKPAEYYGYNDPTLQAAYYQGVSRGMGAAALLMGSEASKALVIEHYKATHDELTGLPNYAGLNEFLYMLGADVENVGVLYLDATNFKAVNDLISHPKGNIMLQEIASLLRGTDFVARIGGDEFLVILLPSTKPGGGRRQTVTTYSMANRLAVTRARIEGDMQAVLARHPDAAALGFDLAIGATLGTVGYSIETLKGAAEAEMKLHKADQHTKLGKYREVGD